MMAMSSSASAFSEQNKLEPMPPERKARWRKEIDWFLSVTDHIVEFVASQQVGKDGTNMEVIYSLSLTPLSSMIKSHNHKFSAYV